MIGLALRAIGTGAAVLALLSLAGLLQGRTP